MRSVPPFPPALLFLALLLFPPGPAGAGEPAADGAVRIDSGLVGGEVLPGTPPVRVFRGIPYAAPPVGPLRWRPPQAVAPWEGVRPCTEFGPVCPQPKSPLHPDRAMPPASEDCLTLNLWTAAGPGGRRPVMVWIHGGGHVLGAGSLPVYDGAALARAGVVLVTFNYRLGPFGYLAHRGLAREANDGTSGNYGMMDQIAALRWVEQNVAAFGGDPSRVTIFGESAGAVSVSCLMVCPAARGLFSRAIAESGGPTGVAPGPRYEQGAALQTALGCDGVEDPLAAMRAKPFRDVLAAARPEAATLNRERKFGPAVDGVLLPDDPAKLWREGKAADVPFLAGSNRDDGGVFSRNVSVRRAEGYRFLVRRRYGEHADEVLALFPPGDDVPLAVRRLITIASFSLPARLMVRGAAGGEAKAWLYRFSRVCPGAERLGVGATHGLEIPYVFGTAGTALGFTGTDRALAAAMRRYWVEFAERGDPNGEGLVVWPAYDPKGEGYLEIGDRISAGAHLDGPECDLLERVEPGQETGEEPRPTRGR